MVEPESSGDGSGPRHVGTDRWKQDLVAELQHKGCARIIMSTYNECLDFALQLARAGFNVNLELSKPSVCAIRNTELVQLKRRNSSTLTSLVGPAVGNEAVSLLRSLIVEDNWSELTSGTVSHCLSLLEGKAGSLEYPNGLWLIAGCGAVSLLSGPGFDSIYPSSRVLCSLHPRPKSPQVFGGLQDGIYGAGAKQILLELLSSRNCFFLFLRLGC